MVTLAAHHPWSFKFGETDLLPPKLDQPPVHRGPRVLGRVPRVPAGCANFIADRIREGIVTDYRRLSPFWEEPVRVRAQPPPPARELLGPLVAQCHLGDWLFGKVLGSVPPKGVERQSDFVDEPPVKPDSETSRVAEAEPLESTAGRNDTRSENG